MCKTTDIFMDDLLKNPDFAMTVVSHVKYFKALLQEQIPETSKMLLCPQIHSSCLK